jgi:hypothetical protein
MISREWWKNYFRILRGTIVRSPDSVQPIHDNFKAFSKWWLELVRNVLVTGGLVSLASKSDSAVLSVFAAFTMGALVCYTLVETNRYEIKLADNVASPAWTKGLSVILTLCITLSLTTWVIKAFLAIMVALPVIGK